VHENHPVRHALEAELRSLREDYQRRPSEETRYRVVRMEQLIAQWARDQPVPA
jgi:hypothetical protein